MAARWQRAIRSAPLNVSGNVTFNAGSTFEVEINPAGQSDKIAASGTATLNGGTVRIVPLGAGFLANTQYTILTAAGGVSAHVRFAHVVRQPAGQRGSFSFTMPTMSTSFCNRSAASARCRPDAEPGRGGGRAGQGAVWRRIGIARHRDEHASRR
ncbi:autotransporter outer membrane beta-barrel domain-containing protein [Bradyrhizobium betae]